MQVVRYDQLAPQVLEGIPVSRSIPSIVRTLQTVAGSFCSDTEIWRHDLSAMNAVAGQKTYSMSPGFSAAVKRVYSAKLSGFPLDLDKASFSPSTNVLTFDMAPSAVAVTGGLVFTVILTPSFKSNEIAEWIIDRWADGIIAGAIADICTRPGVTFNEKIAAYNSMKYENAKAEAMRELLAEYKDGTIAIGKGWDLHS